MLACFSPAVEKATRKTRFDGKNAEASSHKNSLEQQAVLSSAVCGGALNRAGERVPFTWLCKWLRDILING
jgi:hypothetical protein